MTINEMRAHIHIIPCYTWMATDQAVYIIAIIFIAITAIGIACNVLIVAATLTTKWKRSSLNELKLFEDSTKHLSHSCRLLCNFRRVSHGTKLYAKRMGTIQMGHIPNIVLILSGAGKISSFNCVCIQVNTVSFQDQHLRYSGASAFRFVV